MTEKEHPLVIVLQDFQHHQRGLQDQGPDQFDHYSVDKKTYGF